MFVVEASASLPHAPAAVFAAAAGLECAVRWQSGVCGVRRPRGHAPHGGSLLLLYRALGARHLLEAQVTAHEPGQRFAWQATGPEFALEVTVVLEPAAVGPGAGTRVRYRVGLRVSPPPPDDPGLLAFMTRAAELRRLLARRAAGDLARLEAWVATHGRTVGMPAAAPSSRIPSHAGAGAG